MFYYASIYLSAPVKYLSLLSSYSFDLKSLASLPLEADWKVWSFCLLYNKYPNVVNPSSWLNQLVRADAP